jgi:hypothetical protein
LAWASALASAAALHACTNPSAPTAAPTADPAAAPPQRVNASLATSVEWKRETDEVTRPVALVVDRPGGPLDTIVADPDVTTFLNDRFHPVFRTEGGQPMGTVWFLSADGCPLDEPESPGNAGAPRRSSRSPAHAEPSWSVAIAAPRPVSRYAAAPSRS